MLKRLHTELKNIKDLPEGITAHPKSDNDLSYWTATIIGPKNTVYEGGIFKFDMFFPPDFPFAPPKIFCKTKIFHPNFNSMGNICISTLNQDWSPILTIPKILLSISSMIADPNPADPLEPKIAKLMKEDYPKFEETAREWTRRYAVRD